MKHSKAEASSKKEEMVDNEILIEKEAGLVEEVESSNEEDTTIQDAENELDPVQKAFLELQLKFNHLNDNYLRTLAEFDNYRKRSLREKADLIKTGGESVLINILSIVDDMERGLSSTRDAQDIEAVKQGMELIYSKLQSFLKQQGIQAIETEGQVFDTDLHEAITTFPAPSEELKGKVVDCVKKGYYLHDKVIRFAQVVVGE